MRKLSSIVLSLLLCPLTVLAQKSSTTTADALSADSVSSLQAELRVKSVRELEPEAAKALAQVGLHPQLYQQLPRAPGGPRVSRTKAYLMGIIGASLLINGVALIANSQRQTLRTEIVAGVPVVREVTVTDDARLWSGVSLAGAGGVLLTYALAKMD